MNRTWVNPLATLAMVGAISATLWLYHGPGGVLRPQVLGAGGDRFAKSWVVHSSGANSLWIEADLEPPATQQRSPDCKYPPCD